MDTLIVLALPIFALLMAVEFAYGWVRGRNNYGLGDTLSSLSQGLLSQVVAACTQLIQIGLYAIAYPYVALAPQAALWHHAGGVLVAVLAYDFCDYWLHRASHESAIFWAAHVVHHQSEHFNLSTALRQESAYALSGWMFFLPLAVIGIPPGLFAVAGLIVLFYQFWIHTEHIGSLGPLDRIFSTPSNHRVHHAINDRYVDRNYAAVLILWDRIFGTFEPESETCVYGTREPLETWDPLSAVGRNYSKLFSKCLRAPTWTGKWKVLFKSPSWEPSPDSAATVATGSVDLARARYDPPTTRTQRAIAVGLFVVTTATIAAFLWRVDDLGKLRTASSAALAVGSLWLIGALLEGRMAARMVVVLGGLSNAMVCCLVALG